MKETDQVTDALVASLEDVEPVSFRERLYSLLDSVSLTPGVLTIKTASAIQPSIDPEACARRGAGVQLSYEGLRLTRSNVRDQSWEDRANRTNYYLDLLSATVLVSRGFSYLADSGVANQSVEIVQRFVRNLTYNQQPGAEQLEDPLEVDIIKLAVNAGADLAMQTIPPSVISYGDSLAREIQAEPFPEPEDALAGVDERIKALASGPVRREVDEYDSRD